MSAPSDALRELYERRGELEYADPVRPDPSLDRKFEVLTRVVAGLLPVTAYLDAGCGDGRCLAALPALGPLPGRVVGVDIADSILATARRATAEAGFEPELVRANLERLPFAEAEFDLVVSIQVLEHLLDSAAGVRELVRVLRPGGRLVLSTDNRRMWLTKTLNAPRWTVARLLGRRSRNPFAFPHRDFTRAELVALVRQSGLEVERTATVPVQRRRCTEVGRTRLEPPRPAPPRPRRRRRAPRGRAPSTRLAFPRCATSSPVRPASSARTSCARSSTVDTTLSAGTRSPTTTTRR